VRQEERPSRGLNQAPGLQHSRIARALLTKRTTPGPCGRPGRRETRARPAYHARVLPAGSLVTPGGTPRTPGVTSRAPQQATRERTAVTRMCECGLATDDLGLLEDHLRQHGHRERVPWWDKYTQVILARW